ncbi:hypothetical protein KIPB_003858 [Kipferlia bialata]|uniref:Uncharacterized protein n=1 Tax=Kipferlia bialata TaxID=797122 RepID=A0A9K3CT27_9EUKA|nr:hypothetical protein KIPB_003858 [Kipferlia bialata]|eukprot:g3858.t1
MFCGQLSPYETIARSCVAQSMPGCPVDAPCEVTLVRLAYASPLFTGASYPAALPPSELLSRCKDFMSLSPPLAALRLTRIAAFGSSLGLARGPDDVLVYLVEHGVFSSTCAGSNALSDLQFTHTGYCKQGKVGSRPSILRPIAVCEALYSLALRLSRLSLYEQMGDGVRYHRIMTHVRSLQYASVVSLCDRCLAAVQSPGSKAKGPPFLRLVDAFGLTICTVPLSRAAVAAVHCMNVDRILLEMNVSLREMVKSVRK